MQAFDLKKALGVLYKLAVDGQLMSYQQFASELDINTAPIINTVTSFLEQLMIEDVKQQRPVLAAVIVQKGPRALPRQGFFQLLQKLNVLPVELSDEQAIHWHSQERTKLKNFYSAKGSEQ